MAFARVHTETVLSCLNAIQGVSLLLLLFEIREITRQIQEIPVFTLQFTVCAFIFHDKRVYTQRLFEGSFPYKYIKKLAG